MQQERLGLVVEVMARGHLLEAPGPGAPGEGAVAQQPSGVFKASSFLTRDFGDGNRNDRDRGIQVAPQADDESRVLVCGPAAQAVVEMHEAKAEVSAIG